MHPSHKHGLLASAIMLSLGQAMAQEVPAVTQVTSQTNNGSLNLEWGGGRSLDGQAFATNTSVQTTLDNVSSNLERSPNRANIESGAGSGVSGSIGLNIAAGTANLQNNAAAISATHAIDVFATASTHTSQSTMTNFVSNVENSANDASLDAALAGASGNIGVNVAAGGGMAQSNQFSMVETGGSRVSRSAVALEQSAGSNHSNNVSSHDSSNAANNARMLTGALSHSSGSIGANVAAGTGNAQANAMSVNTVR